MDEGQKPWEAFSALERDRYFGETKDYADEASEIKQDITLEEWVPHIDTVLMGILKECFVKRIFDRDTIVVNSKFKEAAEIVARRYRLNLAVHPDFPENELFLAQPDKVEMLITSRVAKVKGYIPSTLLTGVRMHKL